MAIFINLITAAGDPNVQTGAAVTSDATPTSALTVSLQDDADTWIDAQAVARLQGGTEGGAWMERALYFRAGGGGASLRGFAPVEPFEEKSVAALDFNLVISGDDVLLEVTGIALQIWTWTVRALVLVALG